MATKSKKKDAFRMYEYKILQVFPVNDWYAVFLNEEGRRESVAVDFMALIEVTVEVRVRDSKGSRCIYTDTERDVDGLMIGELGFEPCKSFSSFLGMAKEEDVETVDYAASSRDILRICGDEIDENAYDARGEFHPDADDYIGLKGSK